MKQPMNYIQTFWGMLLFCSLLALSPTSSFGQTCLAIFRSSSLPAEASWRSAMTQPSQNQNYAATSVSRERHIQSARTQMEDFILNFQGSYGHGDTPPMQLIPAEGTQAVMTSQSSGVNGVITRLKVTGLGSSGVMAGTLLLPVSGHTGNQNARIWAKTDTYDIRTDTNPNNIPPTPHSWGHTGNEVNLVNNVKSLNLVTAQEIEIPLKANQAVVLTYYRSGSGGPGGYVEGRVIEIMWDGK